EPLRRERNLVSSQSAGSNGDASHNNTPTRGASGISYKLAAGGDCCPHGPFLELWISIRINLAEIATDTRPDRLGWIAAAGVVDSMELQPHGYRQSRTPGACRLALV